MEPSSLVSLAQEKGDCRTMSYEVVVEGEKPHKCSLPMQGGVYKRGVQYPSGTIIACSDCGAYYFLTFWSVGETVYGDWNRVRWYHFGKKRRINGN